jgi:Ni/Co efflux regulator RcnB
MRALILTAAVLIVGSTLSDQATAADRSPHQPSMSHGGSHEAAVTLAAHHGRSGHGYSSYGHSRHGYSSHGYSRHHSLPYRYHGPSYHHGHGCRPPVVVHPPVVVPYPAYPYGYHRGYGYYHGGGVSVNTGRVGFSIAF